MTAGRHPLLPPMGDYLADILAGYVVETYDAAIVAHRGDLDDQVQRLLDDGWTLDESETRTVAGKRLRTLYPPPKDTP